jgi:hypothetical protein
VEKPQELSGKSKDVLFSQVKGCSQKNNAVLIAVLIWTMSVRGGGGSKANQKFWDTFWEPKMGKLKSPKNAKQKTLERGTLKEPKSDNQKAQKIANQKAPRVSTRKRNKKCLAGSAGKCKLKNANNFEPKDANCT